jgi:hypothetical protein
MKKKQVSISSTVTTAKIRTTVYLHQEIFDLMRIWRVKQSLGRENNDSRAIAEAASVFFCVGEERMNRLLRLAQRRAEDPINLASALLSKAIDDIEEG